MKILQLKDFFLMLPYNSTVEIVCKVNPPLEKQSAFFKKMYDLMASVLLKMILDHQRLRSDWLDTAILQVYTENPSFMRI